MKSTLKELKSPVKRGNQEKYEEPYRFSEFPEMLRRALGSWWPGAEPASQFMKRRVPAFQRHFALEALEPRVLLSADPVTSITAGVLTATFTGDADTVDIKLMSTEASLNGGVIVSLKYNNLDHLFGNASTGILGLDVHGGAGDDKFTLDNELP